MEKELPKIECEVTFLTHEEGGRLHPPILNSNYRPHFVVGEPAQREAKRGARLHDGRIYDNTIIEEYLGMQFDSGPSVVPGQEVTAIVMPMYWPELDYQELEPGATFTIREGAKIIGYGSVTRWLSQGRE